MGNLCPRNNFKPCKRECVHFRSGVRVYDAGPKAGQKEAFEECAFNIAVDCLEALVERFIGNQAATEAVRNEMAKLTEMFFHIAGIKMVDLNVKDAERPDIPYHPNNG